MLSRLGRWSLITSSLLLAGMVTSSGQAASSRQLARETSLRAAPAGAALAGLLTAGTEVEVLEQQGPWLRVRLEGWIPSASLEAANAPAPAAQAEVQPSTLAPPATALAAPTGQPYQAQRPSGFNTLSGAGAEVDGWIRLASKLGRKRPGAGARIMLLPAGNTAASLESGHDQQERLDEIRNQAEQLRKRAAAAMRDSNFTRGINRKDDLMAQRQDLITEQLEILAARNGRREAAARARARAITVADPQGWFHFAAVPPGDYTLYVRLNQEDTDLEWLKPVQVTDAPLKLELDESDAHGLQSGDD